jgi:propionyl-CoA carboxylase alpha chain
MIAKLVTHAPTREQAIIAQAAALDEFTIEGIRHNIPFLSALMRHPRWRVGKLSTAFISEEFPKGFHPIDPDEEDAHVLAAVAASIDHMLGARRRRISGQIKGRKVTRAGRRSVRLNDRAYTLDVESGSVRLGDGVEGSRSPTSNSITVRYRAGADQTDAISIVVSSSWKPGDLVWRGRVGERPVAAQVRSIPNGFHLTWQGVQARAHVFTEPEAAAASLMPVRAPSGAGKNLLCPMPGLVVSIAVEEGQEVKAGETLAVVEAMKMENILRAERDGVVKKIRVRPGDSLAVDEVILEIQ